MNGKNDIFAGFITSKIPTSANDRSRLLGCLIINIKSNVDVIVVDQSGAGQLWI